MIGFGLSGPAVPLFLEEDIGITDPVKLKAWVGLIQSASAVTLAVFAPIWGHLADTFSRRVMLLRAMFGGAIVISLTGFVSSPCQFLVLKSIQGCLTGTVAAATVLTAGITPAAQVAFALGLLQTCIAIGNSMGPMIGGVLADFIGYRATFFSTGIVLALSGIVVLKGVDNDAKPRIDPSASGESVSPTKKKKLTIFPDIRPIAASPLLVTLMVITLGVQTSSSVAGPMLPLFLKDLILSTSGDLTYIGSSIGMVMGVGAASTAFAAVLVGKFSTRLGYWKTLLYCLCLGAVFTVPQIFVTNVAQLTILRAISSFFIGGTMPVLNAIIAVSSDKKIQGTIYGINASVSSAGHAIGPMIGSAVAMASYRATFLASALILGFSAWQTSRRRKKLNN